MKDLCQERKVNLTFRGAYRLSGTGIVECLERWSWFGQRAWSRHLWFDLGLGLVILVLVLILVLRIWSCLHHWQWLQQTRSNQSAQILTKAVDRTDSFSSPIPRIRLKIPPSPFSRSGISNKIESLTVAHHTSHPSDKISSKFVDNFSIYLQPCRQTDRQTTHRGKT